MKQALTFLFLIALIFGLAAFVSWLTEQSFDHSVLFVLTGMYCGDEARRMTKED